jgi:hypothetical protein
VIALSQPGDFTDLLTEVLRTGARALLAKAVEAEAADFLEQYSALKTEDGRQRMARHGHLPERAVMTGIMGTSHAPRFIIPTCVVPGSTASCAPEMSFAISAAWSMRVKS